MAITIFRQGTGARSHGALQPSPPASLRWKANKKFKTKSPDMLPPESEPFKLGKTHYWNRTGKVCWLIRKKILVVATEKQKQFYTEE